MGLARSLAWDKGKPKNPHTTPAYGAPDKLRTSVGGEAAPPPLLRRDTQKAGPTEACN
jgi:hypothetical protein